MIDPVDRVGWWFNRSDRLDRSWTGWPGLLSNQIRLAQLGELRKFFLIYICYIFFQITN